MIIAKEPVEVRAYIQSKPGAAVGFVPTMGYLHEGHLSLVERAKKENDTVIVSLFVNPTQFNNPFDREQYPRKEQADQEMLRAAGVDLLFQPSVDSMYPSGLNTQVEVLGLTEVLEGAHRPGHFSGVTLIVAKLFNITSPTRAYFGLKDYQQLKVIEQMTQDLNFPVEVVACPILRDPDGVAMSSRNARLTPLQRQAARGLYQSLCHARRRLTTSNPPTLEQLRAEMKEILQQAGQSEIDYISFNDAETLRPLSEVKGPLLISLAVFFGPLRLIDNLRLDL